MRRKRLGATRAARGGRAIRATRGAGLRPRTRLHRSTRAARRARRRRRRDRRRRCRRARPPVRGRAGRPATGRPRRARALIGSASRSRNGRSHDRKAVVSPDTAEQRAMSSFRSLCAASARVAACSTSHDFPAPAGAMISTARSSSASAPSSTVRASRSNSSLRTPTRSVSARFGFADGESLGGGSTGGATQPATRGAHRRDRRGGRSRRRVGRQAGIDERLQFAERAGQGRVAVTGDGFEERHPDRVDVLGRGRLVPAGLGCPVSLGTGNRGCASIHPS